MGVSVETRTRISTNLQLALMLTNCSVSRKTSDGRRGSKKAASGVCSRCGILNGFNQR